MKGRVFQKGQDRQRLGEAAPWYVRWRAADGKHYSKRFGSGETGKQEAERFIDEVAEAPDV